MYPLLSTLHSRSFYLVGLARSGLACARTLQRAGAHLVVWDDRDSTRQAAIAEGFTVAPSEQIETTRLDSVILSPGIPLTHPRPHPIVQWAHTAGIEIISDLELFFRLYGPEKGNKNEKKSPRFIGITGTNGKSTTTVLTAHILRQAGLSVSCGGNLGTAVFDLPDPGPDGLYLLELSSYQLDLCHRLRLDAAVLLNISPDHLERHGDMRGYSAAKAKIFAHQTPSGIAFVSLDDDFSHQIFDNLNSAGQQQIVPLSVTTRVARGLFTVAGTLHDDYFDNRQKTLNLPQNSALIGMHNRQNTLAAYGLCRFLGLTQTEIERGLRSFSGLTHRQELVLNTAALCVINDSKATNIDSARRALASFDPVVWIAGGQSKDKNFHRLTPLPPSVKAGFFIGECAEQMAQELGESLPETTISHTLEQAVQQALATAERLYRTTGTQVKLLFSPACASFDQFHSFEERGDRFKALMHQYKSKGSVQ